MKSIKVALFLVFMLVMATMGFADTAVAEIATGGGFLAYLIANKIALSGAIVVIVTEIMPFLPTKSNGILHMVVNVFKSIAGKT